MRTFGSVLESSRGIGKGFEFLRVTLSLSVLFVHSYLIAEGEHDQFSGPIFGIFHDALLPMFFALSGFLITGSAMRLRLKDFLLNRGMRIVPALAVDIFISALVIGPLLTTVSLHDYFTSYEFRAYFANVFGVIHYVLPGVFENNPDHATVNGSLWTIPFEIGCYLIMSALIIFGVLHRPRAALLIVATLSGLIVYALLTKLDPLLHSSNPLISVTARRTLSHFFQRMGLSLYICFMLGVIAYMFRYRIPFSPVISVVAAGALICLAAALPGLSTATICTIGAPLIVYVTVQLGLSDLPKLPIFSRGDYSYGIYLYGYPLQQTLVTLFPSLVSPLLHFVFSTIVTVAAAATSWHLVEKPILKLRRKFSFTARKGDATEALPSNPEISPLEKLDAHAKG